MQPEASNKPVMDVTPPRPAAPGVPAPSAPVPMEAPAPVAAPAAQPAANPLPAAAAPAPMPASNAPQPLAVHEAPKTPEEEMMAATQPASEATKPKTPEHKPPLGHINTPKPNTLSPGPRKQTAPLPAGAITIAVLVMLILASLTVVAYLNSK